ncbi:MAG: hypothetical protein ACYC5J_11085 [Chloroflexota bacterium]
MEEPMERGRFLELRYLSLRKEIEEGKSRLFKIVAGGFLILPAAESLAFGSDMDLLMVLLPFVVVVFVLLYVSEHNSIRRCSDFIRLQIEPYGGGIGWESWVQDPTGLRRTADKCLHWGSLLLAALYYVAAACLACPAAYRLVQHPAAIALLPMYAVVGTVALLVMYCGLQSAIGQKPLSQLLREVPMSILSCLWTAIPYASSGSFSGASQTLGWRCRG